MITFRHRTGPLAGQEQHIDGRYDRITIGRDPNVCDVVFPPDATLIARRHFALVRRPSGQWTFDLFGDLFVAVNGEPADLGQALHTGAVIELGRYGGPSFEVKLEAEAAGDQLPVTDPQESFESLHAAAGHAEKYSARARRLAIIGVAVASIAAIASAAIFTLNVSQETKLENAVAALDAAQMRAASTVISPEVRQKLLGAAYLVTIKYSDGREVASGTASPIAPDLLATNAHVAELRDNLKPGDRMLVHAPGSEGRVYPVLETKLHPAYAEFEKFLVAPDPFFVGGRQLSGSASYDVATLRVAPDSGLSPILDIATADELRELGPGSPLAVAGYPTENIAGGEVQPLGATPTFAVGMVTALTDPFHLPADPMRSRLARHNIPATGGSSGSPIVGPNGRVVAYLNSINQYKGPPGIRRVPNAVLINYAQRADLLSDLLSGHAAETLEKERQYWSQQTRTFDRGFDVLIPDLLRRPKYTGNPVLVDEKHFSLTDADLVDQTDGKGNVLRDDDGHALRQHERRHTAMLSSGTTYMFIAYAANAASIELYLLVDGKIESTCGPRRSEACQNVEAAWFPSLSYTPATDTTANIFVVGPSGPDISYAFLQYRWGAAPLRWPSTLR